METIEYKVNPTIDKSTWPKGEWDNEPDKKQWQDPATGLPCLIVRNWSGALCGYVGVPKTHPLYKADYDKPNVDVHGGLTFAGECQEKVNHCEGICHVAPGEDDVWWLGFDCHHYRDIAPRDMGRDEYALERKFDAKYRNFAYVTNQVTNLAAQLATATA